jgi:uroporphyrinogen-III synthase
MTREAEDADGECALLREQAIEVERVPCIACVARHWPVWSSPTAMSVTFLTSRRAARGYLAQGERGGLVAAMAPATTAELAAGGVKAGFEGRGGAASMAEALVTAWIARGKPSWHVRYPTSDVALKSKEQSQAMTTLSRIGAVQRETVYDTQVPPGLGEALRAPVSQPWSACFHSPSAVAAFLAEVPDTAQPPTHVVCFGRSTQAEWNQKRRERWPQALLSASIVETIVSLEESSP